MNKRIGKLLLLALAFSAASCTLFINQNTPKGYVRYAVSLLDRDALYADRPEWKEKRAGVLAAAALLLAAGLLNGGFRDVLVKAVNLCAECVGLG